MSFHVSSSVNSGVRSSPQLRALWQPDTILFISVHSRLFPTDFSCCSICCIHTLHFSCLGAQVYLFIYLFFTPPQDFYMYYVWQLWKPAHWPFTCMWRQREAENEADSWKITVHTSWLAELHAHWFFSQIWVEQQFTNRCVNMNELPFNPFLCFPLPYISMRRCGIAFLGLAMSYIHMDKLRVHCSANNKRQNTISISFYPMTPMHRCQPAPISLLTRKSSLLSVQRSVANSSVRKVAVGFSGVARSCQNVKFTHLYYWLFAFDCKRCWMKMKNINIVGKTKKKKVKTTLNVI